MNFDILEKLNNLFQKLDTEVNLTDVEIKSYKNDEIQRQITKVKGIYKDLPFAFETYSRDTKDMRKEARKLLKFLSGVKLEDNKLKVKNGNEIMEFELNKEYYDENYNPWEIKTVKDYINELSKEAIESPEAEEIIKELEEIDSNMIVVEDKESYNYFLMGQEDFIATLEDLYEQLKIENEENMSM